MPAKPLTQEQLQDAERLKIAFNRRKDSDASLTQEKLAFMCGWKTQGVVNQYLNGKIPLNLKALHKFALALNTPISEISPSLTSAVKELQQGNFISASQLDTEEGFLKSSDGVEIRFYNLSELQRGHVMADSGLEIPVKKMTISKAFLKRTLKFTSLNNLALTSAVGDSMKGTYSDGAILLIDRGVNEIKENGIYGIMLTDEIFTRRIERRLNGDIHIISDNDVYKPHVVLPAEQDRLKVIYRVIFAWTGEKFV